MTRKDYVLLAAALKTSREVCEENGQTAMQAWAHTVHNVAMALASDNPRFDRDVFLAACR